MDKKIASEVILNMMFDCKSVVRIIFDKEYLVHILSVVFSEFIEYIHTGEIIITISKDRTLYKYVNNSMYICCKVYLNDTYIGGCYFDIDKIMLMETLECNNINYKTISTIL